MNGSKPRIDRASRHIAASPQRIYQAFIDAAALVQWLPPKGALGVIDAFEPWPGGAFRMTLIFDVTASPGKTTDNSDVVDGRFVALEPGRRISQRFDFVSADPAFAGTMTMTWTLTPQPDGTLVSIAAENVPVGIGPEDHAAGMTSTLANLAAYVERYDRPD